MTKSELVDAITTQSSLGKTQIEAVINCIFTTLTDAMIQNRTIEIRGFGSWKIRSYSSYQGRNPRTGQRIPVSPKRLPFFKVGKELRKLINSTRNYPIKEDI